MSFFSTTEQIDRRTGKELKAYFTKHNTKFWLIGNQDDENRRAYREFNIAIPIEFPRELLKTYITDMEQDKIQWEQLLKVLSTGKDFEEYFYILDHHYLNAIYIKEAEENTPTDKVYNPYEAPLKSASHVSITRRYIHTNVELSEDTFVKQLNKIIT